MALPQIDRLSMALALRAGLGVWICKRIYLGPWILFVSPITAHLCPSPALIGPNSPLRKPSRMAKGRRGIRPGSQGSSIVIPIEVIDSPEAEADPGFISILARGGGGHTHFDQSYFDSYSLN